MKVRAKKRGEYPMGTWHDAGDIFEYSGPKQVPAFEKQPNGQYIQKGKRDAFPLWMEPAKSDPVDE